jgi:KUP system potassium uptake protein
VVFGDIGTSPLYAFREAVAGASQGQPVTRVMFIALSRSANDATDYFQVPTGRVVEVGTQVTI